MGLLARDMSSPHVHEEMLLVMALVVAALSLAGALLVMRRAPSVSIGLVGAVIAGAAAFFVSSSDGPKNVPVDVVTWATFGLFSAGVFGLIATRAKPPSSLLWRAAIGCLVVAPCGSLLIFLLVQRACPLYVTSHSGYCFYDFDMLGAWATGVAFLSFVDALVVMVLFLISGKQAERRERIRLGDDEWSRL